MSWGSGRSLQDRMIRRPVGLKRRSNDVSITGAEEENYSGLDDPMPRRSNASDYPVPTTSAVRSSTDTSVLRETGSSDTTWSDYPTSYVEKGLTALNG